MAILIVEDDRFFSQLIAEVLSDRGIVVQQVKTAEESLAIDLTDIECAIIDIMLPNQPEVSGIGIEESRGGFYAGIAVARRFLQKKSSIRILFLSSDISGGEAESWAVAHSVPFVRKSEGTEALLGALDKLGILQRERKPLAFIVHGHDEKALLELKNFIQNTLKWQEPIILREQPSSGRTIIEKFEDYAHRVDCVFVLLTPDDKAVSGTSNDERRRSRQNVILELGFFYGALGRRSGRILLLYKGANELPSDISGIIWIDISNGISAASEEIRKEVSILAN